MAGGYVRCDLLGAHGRPHEQSRVVYVVRGSRWTGNTRAFHGAFANRSVVAAAFVSRYAVVWEQRAGQEGAAVCRQPARVVAMRLRRVCRRLRAVDLKARDRRAVCCLKSFIRNNIELVALAHVLFEQRVDVGEHRSGFAVANGATVQFDNAAHVRAAKPEHFC